MAPNTSWEWTEKYGPVFISSDRLNQTYDALEKEVTQSIEQMLCSDEYANLEQRQSFTKEKATVVSCGSGYGKLKNKLREMAGDRPLSAHLQYIADDPAVAFWLRYIEDGKLPEVSADAKPLDFICDKELFDLLLQTIQTTDKTNWYAYYQMGIYCVWRTEYERAESYLMKSMKLCETACVCHALASLHLMTDQKGLANLFMRRGLELNTSDISYVKQGLRFLAMGGGYRDILNCYGNLPEEICKDNRVQYWYMLALHMTGDNQKVFDMLQERPDFELADLREGDNPLAVLYHDVSVALIRECDAIPSRLMFRYAL